MPIDPHDLCGKLCDMTDVAVTGAFPRYWREDGITSRVLESLLSEGTEFALAGPLGVTHIFLDAFQLDGAIEEDHGDIAVLTTIERTSGKAIQGVGFIEAKRRKKGE